MRTAKVSEEGGDERQEERGDGGASAGAEREGGELERGSEHAAVV